MPVCCRHIVVMKIDVLKFMTTYPLPCTHYDNKDIFVRTKMKGKNVFDWHVNRLVVWQFLVLYFQQSNKECLTVFLNKMNVFLSLHFRLITGDSIGKK